VKYAEIIYFLSELVYLWEEIDRNYIFQYEMISFPEIVFSLPHKNNVNKSIELNNNKLVSCSSDKNIIFYYKYNNEYKRLSI